MIEGKIMIQYDINIEEIGKIIILNSGEGKGT